ncbi:hypothetical protein KVR01_005819 [Diaporthe batatas]|uniref:uncharacterized protein n=1 Tax=Diaporthe batatas TaxID=748121 RepID=UPI001D04E025|nr:uncharacterized protein KVR01_005819 [Diaporthe batatas]KAG8163901.1 hypothetical protein KVR01_005819 [Diaporthe batatas]
MASSSPTTNPSQPANNDNMSSNNTSSTMADTGFSDESLDRDWKPNGRRPQSTIARSFSAELADIFRLDNSVADLDAKIDERKQVVQSRASELEALEQRIKDMEARLKRNAVNPAPQATLPHLQPVTQQQQQQPQAQDQKHGGSRPGTARASQQAVPGALPPTPTASEGEYEILEDPYTTSFGPEYPRFRHPHLVPRMTTSANGTGSHVLHQAQQLRSQHYQNAQLSPTATLINASQLHHNINKNPSSDARSIRSVRTIGSENGSADFIIVPGPDGDGEQKY